MAVALRREDFAYDWEYEAHLQEADEQEQVQQRVAAWEASLPAVKPELSLKIGGKQVEVFTGEAVLELRRRDAQLAKLREGRR